MDDVLNIVDNARKRAVERNDQISQMFGLAGSDLPIGALNMAHQYSVLTLELLSFYRTTWRSLDSRAFPDAERTRQENAERVVTITKAAFVLSLSAYEFSAKQALLRWPGRIAPIPGRIYLGNIVKESIAAGRLSPDDLLPWQGIISLRNALVHNNGIADMTKTYAIPGGPTICLVAGQMSQANLRFFPELLLWTIDGFARWCEGFLK